MGKQHLQIIPSFKPSPTHTPLCQCRIAPQKSGRAVEIFVLDQKNLALQPVSDPSPSFGTIQVQLSSGSDVVRRLKESGLHYREGGAWARARIGRLRVGVLRHRASLAGQHGTGVLLHTVQGF
jgi:hypothetical protein